jgi:hypothetical protein
VFKTALAQLRIAASVGFGRPFSRWSLDHVIDATKETIADSSARANVGPSVRAKGRRNTVAERNISDVAWKAHQSNNNDVGFTLDQTEAGVLSGQAEATIHGAPNAVLFRGTVGQGSLVQGDRVQIVVNWEQGGQGYYAGSFAPKGRLWGNTFSLANPTWQATWVSDREFV